MCQTPHVYPSYLGNTVTVPQDNTDLGGGQSLLGQLVDLVLHLVGGELQPLGHGASVGESRLGDALTGSVHTTHREILVTNLKCQNLFQHDSIQAWGQGRARDFNTIVSLLSVLVLIVRLLIVDLEVSELVAVLGAGHHTKPVPQVVLLQILLGEVLQVSLGEGDVGGEGQLGLLSLHAELLAKVGSLASNLDALLKILLEISAVHDAILHGVGAVNEQLDLILLAELLDSFTLPLELLLAGLLGRCLLCCGSHYKWGLYSETRI